MRALAIALFILLVAAPGARAADVTINADAARATLAALSNAALTQPAARAVATLPGNQGLVRKLRSYNLPATTDNFADALVAAAHGQEPTDAIGRAYAFLRIKAKAPAIAALLGRIDADPAGFRRFVSDRVALFTPPAPALHLTGHLIAGGTSGGFAFGEPVTYLNLGYFDEFETVRSVMAHELYHGVQGALQAPDQRAWLTTDLATFTGTQAARQCLNLALLFDALYEEGTASLVGDPLLLDPRSGPNAAQLRDEFEGGLRHVDRSITLLELSVIGLTATPAVPYDDVYALGFYLPEILYKLGYVMARAIVQASGPQALAALLTRPSADFAARYIALPAYGKDHDHPKLAPHTEAAVQRLTRSCSASR